MHEAPADVMTSPELQPHRLDPVFEEGNPGMSFEEFFKRAFPRALNQALKAGSREAEDIANESLLSMWRRWEMIDTSLQVRNKYLAATVARKMIDSSRRKKARPQEILWSFQGDEPEVIGQAIAQGYDDDNGIERSIIARCIASHIPLKYKPYWVRLAAGMSKEEIAEDFAISPRTVKNNTHTLRRRLIDEMKESGL